MNNNLLAPGECFPTVRLPTSALPETFSLSKFPSGMIFSSVVPISPSSRICWAYANDEREDTIIIFKMLADIFIKSGIAF